MRDWHVSTRKAIDEFKASAEESMKLFDEGKNVAAYSLYREAVAKLASETGLSIEEINKFTVAELN